MISFGFESEEKGDNPDLIKQVHGAQIVLGTTKPIPEADGIWTEKTQETLYVFSADCLPVLFGDPSDSGPIAAIHCGWRGAMAGIVSAGVTILSAKSSTLKAILGPAIGPCCFEVREDFISQFSAARGDIANYLQKKDDRKYFDLPRFVIERELRGVMEIETSHLRCTFCSEPSLPSFRRNGSTAQRIRSWIRRD